MTGSVVPDCNFFKRSINLLVTQEHVEKLLFLLVIIYSGLFEFSACWFEKQHCSRHQPSVNCNFVCVWQPMKTDKHMNFGKYEKKFVCLFSTLFCEKKTLKSRINLLNTMGALHTKQMKKIHDMVFADRSHRRITWRSDFDFERSLGYEKAVRKTGAIKAIVW